MGCLLEIIVQQESPGEGRSCSGKISMYVCVCDLREEGVFRVLFPSKRLARGRDKSARLPNTTSKLPADSHSVLRVLLTHAGKFNGPRRTYVSSMPRCPQLEASTHADTHTQSSCCIAPPGVPVAPALPCGGCDKETDLFTQYHL